jgi:hypothetical protein
VLAAVKGGEEPGRHAGLERRTHEGNKVVVGAGQQMIGVGRVSNDRRLVVRRDRIVAAQVDVSRRATSHRASPVGQRAASHSTQPAAELVGQPTREVTVLAAVDRALVGHTDTWNRDRQK